MTDIDAVTEPMTTTGRRLVRIHVEGGPYLVGRPSAQDILAIEREAREQERERLRALLRREAQNALDSGIRPSGRELDAWNYVARHFLDNADVILTDPESVR